MWKALVEWWKWGGVGEDVKQLCLSLDVPERWKARELPYLRHSLMERWVFIDTLTGYEIKVCYSMMQECYRISREAGVGMALTRKELSVVDKAFARAIRRWKSAIEYAAKVEEKVKAEKQRKKLKEAFLPPVLTDVVHICQCVCKCKGEGDAHSS